jgi:hypothetical protein
MVTRHIDLVSIDVRVSASLDILNAPKARPGRQAIFVLAGYFTGAASDAVHVVVDERQLHIRYDRHIDLSLFTLHGFLNAGLVNFLCHHD